MAQDLKKMYKTIMDDHFPPEMEISFVDPEKRQTLFYEKVVWVVDDIEKGLRYGENPGQEAALYKLTNGNLVLGELRAVRRCLGQRGDKQHHALGPGRRP